MFRSKNLRRSEVVLPGTSATVTVVDSESAGGQPFGMVAIPTTADHTVILSVGSGVGVTYWCSRWRDAVRLLSDSPDVTAITATWDNNEGTISAHVAVTFRAAVKEHHIVDEHAVEIGVRLPHVIASLSTAGFPATPLTRSQLVDWIADAYQDSIYPDTDDPDSDDLGVIPMWPEVIPDNLDEARSSLTHGDACSVTWLHHPVRVIDNSVMLRMLTEVTGKRIRVTSVYRPSSDDGILHRYLVTTTITNREQPDDDAARIDDLPIAARLALRRGYSRQGELFATGLGVGVLLPEHGRVAAVPVHPRSRKKVSA